MATLNRRGVLAGLGLMAPSQARAETGPHRGSVQFEVFRNGQRIGAHSVGFHGDDSQLIATIESSYAIQLEFDEIVSMRTVGAIRQVLAKRGVDC